jgi:hypothetical protein
MFSNIIISMLSPYIDILTGIINLCFGIRDQVLIIFSAFMRYWRKNGGIMRKYISYSWTSRNACGSVRR